MRGDRTPEMLAKIDEQIGKDPIDPVLGLWEALRKVGGMPNMGPDHMREILIALRKARGEWRRV